jgi:hypothetical protein
MEAPSVREASEYAFRLSSALQQAIIRTTRRELNPEECDRRDWKGKLSPVLYIVAIIATLRSSRIAWTILVIAALIC